MENTKTILFFVLAAIALVIVSVGVTGQIEADISPLPTATATPTDIAQATCETIPVDKVFGTLPGAPSTTTLAAASLPGQRLVIFGTVYASDCITPLPNALVQVWQADIDGHYDRSEPYTLRGKMHTDANGYYQFSTIKPGRYDTRSGTQPAHLHYWISYGDDTWATRLYFSDDPYLETQGISPLLVTPLIKKVEANGEIWQGVFDIVLPVPAP